MTPLLLALACAGAQDAPPPWPSRGPGAEPTAAALGGAGDTLVLAFASEPGPMLPGLSTSALDAALHANLFMPAVGQGFDCGVVPEPAFYAAWSFSEDGRVLSVTLREDLRWSDGVPMSARDVAFTYALLADPAVASPSRSWLDRMVEGKRPLVLDDHHLEFHFTDPYDPTTMLVHAAATPLPAHALEGEPPASLRASPLARQPVVSGPFQVEDWQPGASLTLTPNPAYGGPEADAPRLARVRIKVIPEYVTRLVELENGSVDWMDGILPVDAARLAGASELALLRRGWRGHDFVAWNLHDPDDPEGLAPHPVLGEAAVRRALAQAMNVERVIADLLTDRRSGEALGRRSVSAITPSLCEAHNDAIAPLPFDPARARAELAAAGWVDDDGDGVRERGGRRLAFTLLTNTGNPLRAKVALLLQADLRAAGAEVEIEKLPSGQLFERLRARRFEAALAGWEAELHVDLASSWRSGEQSPYNYAGYANPRVDALIDALFAESDPRRARALLHEAQALIYEDQPFAFLYWQDKVVGVHRRFRDVKVDLVSPLHQLWTWWVPPEERRYGP